MCWGDVVERYHFIFYAFWIALHNLSDSQWTLSDAWMLESAYIFFLSVGVECLIDWLKHSFILRYNRLTSSVYIDASKALLRHAAEGSMTQASRKMSDSLGFLPLPFVCLSFFLGWGILPPSYLHFTRLLLLYSILFLCRLLVLFILYLISIFFIEISPPSTANSLSNSSSSPSPSPQKVLEKSSSTT